MLCLLAIMLLMASSTDGAIPPKVWGSRIVTTESGSERVSIEFSSSLDEPTFDVDGAVIKIATDKCVKEDGSLWSSPCSYTSGRAVISISNVSDQKYLLITDSDGNQITVFFVPGCKFDEPTEGGVILNESVPLSRFVAEQTEVPLRFAVQGVSSEVKLVKNTKLLCHWKGIQWSDGIVENCKTGFGSGEQTDLYYDKTTNMRIFEKEFLIPQNSAGRDFYFWSGLDQKTFLSVTVDSKHSGGSSELDGCKDETKPPTTPTTSAGFAQNCMIEVYLGLSCLLLYLRK